MSWGVFLTSLVVGLALQPLLIPWLKRLGVMDVPNERSSHIEITPRGGGIAVVAALGAGLLVGRDGGGDLAIALLGAIALGSVGLADDFHGLSAKARLGIVLIVGALSGLMLSSPLPIVLAVLGMAIWTAAYVNAFNFMDGINGISGLTGLVSGIAYALMGVSYDSGSVVVIGTALAGASLSFLPSNIPSAKVFLGDVGSYSLGFVIAALGWLVWAAGAPISLALAPAAVYLADTGATLLRRYRRKAPLMVPHREHVYQRLVIGGRSHSFVALLTAAFQVLVILLVLIGITRDWAAGGAFLGGVAVFAYLASPRVLATAVETR